MKTRYSAKDRLKSKKCIEQLFEEGKSISSFPLRMVYMPTYNENGVIIKAGVSVSKRNFKKAVDRNRIKRLLREAYRLQKNATFNNFTTHYAFMILYIGNEIPSYLQIEEAMKLLLEKFTKVNPK